jgi:hypothetical protein
MGGSAARLRLSTLWRDFITALRDRFAPRTRTALPM